MNSRDIYTEGLTLLSALGRKRMLVLELLDFLSNRPDFVYAEEATELRKIFKGYDVSKVVLICTDESEKVYDDLKGYMESEYPDVDMEKISLSCSDITCSKTDKSMRKIVYDAIERHAGPNLIISSAGRKTITQRIIEAGMLFGAWVICPLQCPMKFQKNMMTLQR